jgi:hypothetical protein
MVSVNNKLICTPYEGGKSLKAEVKSGFATVQQKNNVVGLELLADAKVSLGGNLIDLKKGTMVYFSEEVVYNNKNFHTPIKNDILQEQFIIADFNQAIFYL